MACPCSACVAHRSVHCLAAKNAQWKWAARRDAPGPVPKKKAPTIWDDVAETRAGGVLKHSECTYKRILYDSPDALGSLICLSVVSVFLTTSRIPFGFGHVTRP